MRKFQNNTFRVAAILMMLSTASLGVSYSHAESEENIEVRCGKKPTFGELYERGYS